eukprot:Seg2866.2 transcript_id=Seg2866.2/GoldUCD/mRNA.D3Y31 product="hypothetical protein" protein_id=Seg2866.2/GoldUCD/D3Y31
MTGNVSNAITCELRRRIINFILPGAKERGNNIIKINNKEVTMKLFFVLILLAYLVCYECKKKKEEVDHIENMTNRELANRRFDAPIKRALHKFNKKHGTKYISVRLRRGFYTDKSDGSRVYKLDLETVPGYSAPGVSRGFCEVQFVMKKNGRFRGAKVNECKSYKKDPSNGE